jgi:LmbE family N-acetylglucosaminyl deacetylase
MTCHETLERQAPVHAYEPTPTRADLLVVFAHPDDEVSTFGAIIPHYLACGRSVAAVCMTRPSDESTAALRERELRESLWTCGMPHEPLLAGFPDCGFLGPDRFESLEQTWERWGGRAAVSAFMADLYRRFQPTLVFTHNPETGEYGHPNHQAIGWACLDAYDALLSQHDPATPRKIYTTSRTERAWRIDWNRPLSALGGRSADVVASKALRCHRSQSCSTAGVRAYLAYELVRSQVGADRVKTDFFEGCRGGA